MRASPSFRDAVTDAILSHEKAAPKDFENIQINRYVTALEMIAPLSRPHLRVVDVASFGRVLPALQSVLGLADVRCTDVPLPGKEASDTIRLGTHCCPLDRFDIEERFPYADCSFDLVLLTEVIEHISRDPMHTLSEINRITAPGGHLLLTTPNAMSLRSVAKILRGNHPSIWSTYSRGVNRDRHNREYTAFELNELLEAAGYRVATLRTCDDAYVSTRAAPVRRAVRSAANMGLALVSMLAGRYVPPRMRGEGVFILAQKAGPVRDRFPQFLYY